jgi:metacaspase-1
MKKMVRTKVFELYIGDAFYETEYENTLGVGKRRAVIIGINYFGQEGELGGCVNDSKFFLEYLQEHEGFDDPNTTWVLTDDQEDPEYIPTKDKIEVFIVNRRKLSFG